MLRWEFCSVHVYTGKKTIRITTRIDVYETLCPQQMFVHKGGQINNLRLNTGMGSAGMSHLQNCSVKYPKSIAGILPKKKEEKGGSRRGSWWMSIQNCSYCGGGGLGWVGVNQEFGDGCGGRVPRIEVIVKMQYVRPTFSKLGA